MLLIVTIVLIMMAKAKGGKITAMEYANNMLAMVGGYGGYCITPNKGYHIGQYVIWG